MRIDLRLGASDGAVGIVGLLVDAIPRTVLPVGGPRHNPATILERRDAGIELIARRKGVDTCLKPAGNCHLFFSLGLATLETDRAQKSKSTRKYQP